MMDATVGKDKEEPAVGNFNLVSRNDRVERFVKSCSEDLL